MDNLPRVKRRRAHQLGQRASDLGGCDLQAILSAKILLQMAALLGREAEVEDLAEEYQRLKNYSNQTSLE